MTAALTGPDRRELASVIQSVNARHHAIGTPEVPGLNTAWLRLDRAIEMAKVAGDETATRTAITSYHDEAMAALEQQAEQIHNKEQSDE